MVMQHDGHRLAQAGGLLEYQLADPRMLGNGLPLELGQSAGLVKDVLRQGYLSDVMKQAGEADALDVSFGQSHLGRHLGSQRGDHVRRAPAVVRLRGEDGSQRFRGPRIRPLAELGRLLAALAIDRRAAHPALLVHRAEDVRLVPAQRLRGIHSGIGISDQPLEAELTAGIAGHANADRGSQGRTICDRERRLHHDTAQLLSSFSRLLGFGAGHDEHELLTAIAPEEVARADVVGDQVRNLTKNCVARVMAVGVIDALEAVDVHECDGQRLSVAVGTLDLGRERRQQCLAVGDACQTVTGGTHFHLRKRQGRRIEGARQASLDRQPALAHRLHRLDCRADLKCPGQREEAPGDQRGGRQGH